MPYFTRADIQGLALDIADMSGSTFVDQTNLDKYFDISQGELYNLLTKRYGDNYLMVTASLQTVVNQETVPLPADCFKVVSLEYLYDGASPNNFIVLEQTNINDRGRDGVVFQPFIYDTSGGWYTYMFQADSLLLYPVPSRVDQLRLRYVPSPAAITGSTTFNYRNNQQQFVAVDIARQILRKAQDPAHVELYQEKEAIKAEIMSDMSNRNQGRTQQIMKRFDEIGPYGRRGRGNW